MFRGRRKGPWPPTPPEDFGGRFKAIISNITEVVPGGILRAGTKTAWGEGTGWWIGNDPSDEEQKIDFGSPTDYLRYSQTHGVQIAADGSGMTNIDGGNIQTGTVTAAQIAAGTITATEILANTITAAEIAAGTITATEILANTITAAQIAAGTITATEITVANLQALSVQTGALTVDNTLTMGEDGIISWMSGAAKITDDYMDVALTTSQRYAFRFIDGEAVHAYIAAYKSANLTQLSIETVGPAVDKYGKIALSAIEHISTAEEPNPETVDLTIRSDTGAVFSALNYAATRIFKVDTMDAQFTNNLGIGKLPAADLHVYGGAATNTTLRLEADAGQRSTLQIYKADTLLAQLLYLGDAGAASQYFGFRNIAATGGLRFINDVAKMQFWQQGDAGDNIQFYTYNSATTRLSRFLISCKADIGVVAVENAKFGVNTNSPTAYLDVNSDIMRLRTAKTPATAGAAGNQGDICWDASYIYVCTATNAWKRAAIATW